MAFSSDGGECEDFLDSLVPEDGDDLDGSLVVEERPFNLNDQVHKEFCDSGSLKKNLRGVSHMSTIAEESQILEDLADNEDVPGSSKVGFTESSPCTAQSPELQTSEGFTSAEFVRGGGLEMQRHEESFMKNRFLNRNDYRFNKSHQEKENSWEPSIHESALPLPVIQETLLQEKLNTNSHISIDDSSEIKINSGKKATEHGNSGVNIDLSLKTPLSDAEPKISTPNAETRSKRERLRDVSLNFNNISAILPANNGVRRRSEKFTELIKNYQQELSQIDFLSSSAISAAIGSAGLNDTALVNALFKARTRFQEDRFKELKSAHQKNASYSPAYEAASVSKEHQNSDRCNEAISNKSIGQKPLCKSSATDCSNAPSARSGSCTSVDKALRGSCSMLVTEGNRARVLSFKPAFLYFGFVKLGAKMPGSIKLRNISKSTVNLKISLRSSRGFTLLEQGPIILHPNESYPVRLFFQPMQAAYFKNRLEIRVLNADHLKYSVPVEGSGGVACLEIKQGEGINMARDGSFVMKMGGQASVSFVVENKGIRDAFVKVVVRDKSGKQVDNVQVFPSDYAVVLHRNIQKFELNWEADFLNKPAANITTSSLSHSSSPGYCVQLLWGQEGQRRRLKRFEELKKEDILVAGFTFTKVKVFNAEAASITKAESNMTGDFDLEAFESELRVITISVVDNRFLMTTGQLSQHLCSESVLLNPDETLASTFSNVTVYQDVSTMEC